MGDLELNLEWGVVYDGLDAAQVDTPEDPCDVGVLDDGFSWGSGGCWGGRLDRFSSSRHVWLCCSREEMQCYAMLSDEMR